MDGLFSISRLYGLAAEYLFFRVFHCFYGGPSILGEDKSVLVSEMHQSRTRSLRNRGILNQKIEGITAATFLL